MIWNTAFNRCAKPPKAALIPIATPSLNTSTGKPRRSKPRANPSSRWIRKKRELIGDFHNKGQEWQRAGSPEPVRVHDFIDPELGKAIPYGVYDVARNEGWAPYRVLRGGYFYYTAASLLPPYRSYSFPSYRY